MRRGAETGEEVVLIEHERLEMGGRGAEAPAPASHSASESTSDRAWASLAGVRSTGTRAPLLGSPRAPGGAERDSFTFEFHRSGYAAQEPRLAARHPGPWAESDGGSGPTVRCTSTEPADTDSPITAHATLCTRDNNPDKRTTATRASGNTRARSCPHRWTRRISKGQATSQTRRILKGQASNKSNAKDLEGTSNRPRGEMTGTIMRGAVCPSSEDGGQASAASTSRHEVRDGEESQRMGTRMKI